MDELIEELANSTFKTDSGNVYFRKGVVEFYDIDTFIQILIDLHLRATKQKPIFEDIESISDYDARTLYSIANANLIFNSSYLSNENKEDLISKILTIAYERKSFEALESIYLTLAIDIKYFDELKSDYFLVKFMVIGFAKKLGGGFTNSYIFDIKNDLIIGFNRSIEEKLKNELLSNKISGNFLNRLKDKNNQVKLDAATTIGSCVIIGALIFSGVGVAATAGGAAAGLVVGVTEWHAKVDKEYQKNNKTEGVGKNEGSEETEQNDDEKDDKKPEPPKDGCKEDNSCSTEENTEGCIINPHYADFKDDPYLKFSKARHLIVMPYGEGLKVFGNAISSNQFKLNGRPKFEIDKNGLLNFSSMGFWSYSNEFKIFAEKTILKRKEYLAKIQKSIDSNMSDFEVKYETNYDSTDKNLGNETNEGKSEITIVFTNPPIGEITMPYDDMAKFIETLEFILRQKKKDVDFGQEKMKQIELEKLKNSFTKSIIE